MAIKSHSRTRAEARRVKITKRFVDSVEIPPAEKKYGVMYWDTELAGFALRVFPSGRRVYLTDYFDKRNKQHRIALGTHGILTPDRARERAKDILSAVRLGEDGPAEERQAARGAITFHRLVEDYVRLRCSEKKSGAEDARILTRECVPAWGRRLASDVSRGDVKRLTAEIKKRGPIMANRTLSCIRRLFNWCIDSELVSANPAARIKPLVRETSKDRVLSNAELRSFWNTLDKVPAAPESRIALKLILATAARPGEVVSLEWNEINTEERIWNLPAEKSKNGREHRIPLSPLALGLLASLPHDSNFVFPSRRNLGRHLTRAAIGRALRNGRALMKAEPFSPHDLRRTAASRMAEMGIGRLTISKILNHTDRTITAVYDRWSYLPEMESALTAWGERLRAIVEGRDTAKIVPLAR